MEEAVNCNLLLLFVKFSIDIGRLVLLTRSRLNRRAYIGSNFKVVVKDLEVLSGDWRVTYKKSITIVDLRFETPKTGNR